MLNNIEFDLWADGYDKTVGISDEENTYPFALNSAVTLREAEDILIGECQ